MNQTIPLPAAVESRLINLEARHQRHQQMLEDHREAKHDRRKRHREGWHKRKYTAHILP